MGMATNSFTYDAAGNIHSPSTLYYYGYRFYNPSLQRWVNADPLGEEGFEAVRNRIPSPGKGGRNLYNFVKNSPMSRVDPKGLRCCNARIVWSLRWLMEHGCVSNQGTAPDLLLTVTGQLAQADSIGHKENWVSEVSIAFKIHSIQNTVWVNPPRKGCEPYNNRRWTPKKPGPNSRPPGPPARPGRPPGEHRGSPGGHQPPPGYVWADR